jgi:hypothetical protein
MLLVRQAELGSNGLAVDIQKNLTDFTSLSSVSVPDHILKCFRDKNVMVGLFSATKCV